MFYIITAGHYASKPGATHNGFSEYPETEVWATELTKALMRDNRIATRVASGPLTNKINTINQLAKGRQAIAIEIHFNSYEGDELVTGCETLYCPGSEKGKEFATIVQSHLADALGNNDRGVKEGWYRMDKSNGPDALLSKTTCPAIIIEPEFIQVGKKSLKKMMKPAIKAILTAIDDYETSIS